jgi:exodeoxyribonuclease VII large subunit
VSALHAALGREGARTVARARERLDADAARLARAPAALVARKRAELDGLAGSLRALSPQATLGRGYAIVRSGDAVVRSGSALAPGERVDVRLAEGGFGAVVEETR